MNVEGFIVTDLTAARARWIQSAPYATLRFASTTTSASRAQLNSFLNLLGIDDRDLRGDIVARFVDALMRSGDLFEDRPQRYSVFPPYAVQMSDDEWSVHGSTVADGQLTAAAELFEIESGVRDEQVTVRRTLMDTEDNARAILEESGVRSFLRTDMIDLIADVRVMNVPRTWEGYEPGPYAEWEAFDVTTGLWRSIDRFSTQPGIRRGIAIDEDGRRLATRHFWRHADGWSPITNEDADSWVLRLSHERGRPCTAHYETARQFLTLSSRVPYSTWVALTYLGRHVATNGSNVEVQGVDAEIARLIAERHAMLLEVS